VKLVVFESFQCPHCQRLALALPRLEREFGDRLLVVYKQYPLSSRCNDRLRVDMQPDACELAWAAEAARRQARYWQFREGVLTAGQRASAGSIERAVRGAGLEPARFEADRRSAAVRERVAEDIALGNQLQLPGTPAIYLDGRPVRPASAELIEILIRHELERGAMQTPRADRAARQTGRPQPG
jgi:protein-disulfide isomerase